MFWTLFEKQFTYKKAAAMIKFPESFTILYIEFIDVTIVAVSSHVLFWANRNNVLFWENRNKNKMFWANRNKVF